MGNLFSFNLITLLPAGLKQIAEEWLVLAACAISGFLGVLLSFKVAGLGQYNGNRFFFALFITLVMLAVSYAAKASDPSARIHFSTLDFLQFAAQGALWPAAVPGIATTFNIPNINPSPSPTVSVSP